VKGSDKNKKSGAENSGTAPAAPVSGADDAAAALQAQIDGGGTPPPPAEGAASPPAAPQEPPAPIPAAKEPAPVVPPAPPVLKWYVRAGRSITSPSGVIGEHHEVKPTDIALPDEKRQLEQLAYLVEKNILYRAYEPGNEVVVQPGKPVDLRPPQSKKKK
jgi:hypothetical protein